MAIWKLVKLNFGRNLSHFGDVGIGLEAVSERVHSDTLFSAWMSNYARLFGSRDIENFLTLFPHQEEQPTKHPPFYLSSTFIYHKQDETRITYYLPKPIEFPKRYPIGKDLKFTKAYKKLNYLPLEIWQRWYQGEGFTTDDNEQLKAHNTKSENGYKNKQLEQAGTFNYSNTYQIHLNPKIAIDRNTNAANIYSTGFVQYLWESPKQSGLYFLIKFPQENQELENKLVASLNLLGDEGLGGERSSGAGQFIAEWIELPQQWQEVINFTSNESINYCLISLFWENPLSSAIDIRNNQASYTIIERGGWLCSPVSSQQLRRKKVRMFGEGSVFSSPPQGQLADVTPDHFTTHKIYRSGISLSLPTLIEN